MKIALCIYMGWSSDSPTGPNRTGIENHKDVIPKTRLEIPQSGKPKIVNAHLYTSNRFENVKWSDQGGSSWARTKTVRTTIFKQFIQVPKNHSTILDQI
ncbi:hypothetical protein HanIR_Chr07g0316411 [Helianthus annuus]|nr:hypothetical protein HanIR_Chr07g0316411 [Helianthus annuus]